MRLIDADALIVEIKICLCDWEYVNGIKAKTILNQTITEIGNMPTIDAVPAWIPVTERLPENEVTVLVVRKFLGIKDCPAKTYVETAEYCYGDWVADSDEYKIARSKHTDPLYWMPLPEPPKEETHDNN